MEEHMLHGFGRLCAHGLEELAELLGGRVGEGNGPLGCSGEKALQWHEAVVSCRLSEQLRAMAVALPDCCCSCDEGWTADPVQERYEPQRFEVATDTFVLQPSYPLPASLRKEGPEQWWRENESSLLHGDELQRFQRDAVHVTLVTHSPVPATLLEVTPIFLAGPWRLGGDESDELGAASRQWEGAIGEGFFTHLSGIRALLHRTVIEEGCFLGASLVSGTRPRLYVSRALPSGKGPLRVTKETRIIVTKETQTNGRVEESVTVVTKSLGEYEDTGAEEDSSEEDEEYVELMRILKLARDWKASNKNYAEDELRGPRGILVKGGPGVGKSYIVKKALSALGADVTFLDGSLVFSLYVGDSEKKLRSAFAKAAKSKASLSVVVLDQLDMLCPNRDQASLYEGRIVAQLLTLMDGLVSSSVFETQEKSATVVVVGIACDADSLDPALRRHGRFDHELLIGGGQTASAERRCRLLRSLCRGVNLEPSFGGEDYEELARTIIGYVAADIRLLCQEAVLAAHERIGASSADPEVTRSDFDAALLRVRPTVTSAISVEVPHVEWSDIGGLEGVKRQLISGVLGPIQNKEQYERFGLSIPRGVLLYGPPGCCKTTLVKALATAANANFLSLNGAEVYSPYLGDAEATVRECFERARAQQPCLVFFDEIDAIVGKRMLGGGGQGNGVEERVLSTLLNELDGVSSASSADVILVAATNRKDLLDEALLRPGRIDKVIEVPLPNVEERRLIVDVKSRAMPLADDVDKDVIAAALTIGMSGAEIENLCREAALVALRESIDAETVTMEHFRAAHRHLNNTTATANPLALKGPITFSFTS